MSDVRHWLEGIGLGQSADAFEANNIDMDLLQHVDDQRLKDIGITSAVLVGSPARLVGEERSQAEDPNATGRLSERLRTHAFQFMRVCQEP